MQTPVGRTIFFVVFILFVTVWRTWETFRKQGGIRGQTSMLWSFYALFALGGVILLGTVAEFFLLNRPWHLLWAILGVVLFVISNAIRLMAIRALGEFWSLHIEIRERHPFVCKGVYRYLRHPAYCSFVLEAIAIPLVGNAWWSLGVAVLVYTPLLLLRLNHEEMALVAKFGETYRSYQREVGALVPKCHRFAASNERDRASS